MQARPKVGVTLSQSGSFWVWQLHKLALWRAGAQPVKVTAGAKGDWEALSGLVVGGGDDISFQLDGTDLNPNIRYDPARDELERELLGYAFDRGMPVLGVCRGAQMINLVLGGTLYMDVSEISEDAPRGRILLPKKRIEISQHSKLSRIMNCNPCRVNALHHQAVRRTGKTIEVVARDDLGIVQAIESTEHNFTLGVQWHPEMLPFSVPQMNLFRALVASCR